MRRLIANHKKTILIAVVILTIMAFSIIWLLLMQANSNNHTHSVIEINDPAAIAFVQSGNSECISDQTVFKYKKEMFKKLKKTSAMIFLEPVKNKPDTLMKNYNFNKDTGKQTGSYLLYKYGQFRLELFEYGNFGFFNDENADVSEIKLSDQECMKIAQNFLEKNNLYDDDIEIDTHVFPQNIVSDKGTFVYGKTVCFRPKPMDGEKVLGNSRITIDIGSNGNIKSVIYNHRRYAKSGIVPIISVQEAYDRIKEGKANFDISSPSSELVFEDVSLNYYENVMETDSLCRQPVYTFKGTSTTQTGEKEPFSVTVQAADYN